jgi:hypothetical protein
MLWRVTTRNDPEPRLCAALAAVAAATTALASAGPPARDHRAPSRSAAAVTAAVTCKEDAGSARIHGACGAVRGGQVKGHAAVVVADRGQPCQCRRRCVSPMSPRMSKAVSMQPGRCSGEIRGPPLSTRRCRAGWAAPRVDSALRCIHRLTQGPLGNYRPLCQLTDTRGFGWLFSRRWRSQRSACWSSGSRC